MRPVAMGSKGFQIEVNGEVSEYRPKKGPMDQFVRDVTNISFLDYPEAVQWLKDNAELVSKDSKQQPLGFEQVVERLVTGR